MMKEFLIAMESLWRYSVYIGNEGNKQNIDLNYNICKIRNMDNQ